MLAELPPRRSGQCDIFERLKIVVSLLISVEQVLLAVLQLIRLIGC
jgi:hypothetical protein